MFPATNVMDLSNSNTNSESVKYDASTKRPQPVFILSIKSSLNDFIPDKDAATYRC